MKCDICKKPIEVKRTPKGKVYWDQGNNALPIVDGRCCDVCDETVVIPARLSKMMGN
jgi:hypothetical protein|tara:strand:+ start:3584 stop:3754 length:171 start_codon:yes stop_codon:yes gene_type:complete